MMVQFFHAPPVHFKTCCGPAYGEPLQLPAALLPLADIHVFGGRILDGINVLVCQERFDILCRESLTFLWGATTARTEAAMWLEKGERIIADFRLRNEKFEEIEFRVI